MPQSQTYAARSVDEAIKAACADLNCERDELDIEILSPGVIGLFGICFKKAKIRVRRKTVPPVAPAAPLGVTEASTPSVPSDLGDETPAAACQRLLAGLLDAMGCPSTVTVEDEEGTLAARITGDQIDTIIGANGESIDAIQYLLRKMLSKQFRRKIAVTVDAGTYRAQRQQELESLARRLAEEVKATGRTRSTAPLNPAERRIVHMAIQEDPAIRSRSVGDGLYKKVIISPPGRGRRPSRRRQRAANAR